MNTNLRGYLFSTPLRAGAIAGYVARHKIAASLLGLALLTRLPLLSVSIDEVDAANFVNALIMGYDVPLLRPHPPGYPVYMFLGWLAHGFVESPHRALTLLSAALGSLAVVPFYSLLKQFTSGAIALAGSLLFIVNPLFWSFSEAALSDVPGVFFAVTLVWLVYQARHSFGAFLAACALGSLAIGVRQPAVAFLPLLVFPLAYRWLALKERPWSLAFRGLEVFLITTALWALPMIFLGSDGFSDYVAAATKQWSTAVKIYDYSQVDSPWLLNLWFRAERFFYGYFFTYSWTGDDAKTAATLLLVAPWLAGFALFVVGFSFKNSNHVLVALWMASIGYTIMAIHFLPRYGLAQGPGLIIAAIMGYQFLGSHLLKHPRRLEILAALGIGCGLMVYGIKYQPPVNTFEFTPPQGSFYPGMLFAGGILFLLMGNLIYRRSGNPAASPANSAAFGNHSLLDKVTEHYPKLLICGLALFAIPFGFKGYSLAAIAHNEANPTEQLVYFARDNFEPSNITPCWDNQTHSYFESLIPGVEPTGYWSIDDLYNAHRSGKTLLATDRCMWYAELDRDLGLTEVARFSGASPLWSKAPSLRLYATEIPPLLP